MGIPKEVLESTKPATVTAIKPAAEKPKLLKREVLTVRLRGAFFSYSINSDTSVLSIENENAGECVNMDVADVATLVNELTELIGQIRVLQ